MLCTHVLCTILPGRRVQPCHPAQPPHRPPQLPTSPPSNPSNSPPNPPPHASTRRPPEPGPSTTAPLPLLKIIGRIVPNHLRNHPIIKIIVRILIQDAPIGTSPPNPPPRASTRPPHRCAPTPAQNHSPHRPESLTDSFNHKNHNPHFCSAQSHPAPLTPEFGQIILVTLANLLNNAMSTQSVD